MKWTTRAAWQDYHVTGGNVLAVDVPITCRNGVQKELDKADARHNGYVTVAVTTPRKPRTTGPESQNNHCWGHATQIAEHTGHEVEEIMFAAKQRAMKRGYPYDVIGGEAVPWSQARVSTTECAALIEEMHQIADELDIALEE